MSSTRPGGTGEIAEASGAGRRGRFVEGKDSQALVECDNLPAAVKAGMQAGVRLKLE